MARTKQIPIKLIKGKNRETATKKKVINVKKNILFNSKSKPAIKKAHRWRPGVKALREIRKYQKSTLNLIPKQSFQRVVREIIQDLVYTDIRLRKEALFALQEAAEQHLIEFFQSSNLLAIHCGRCTVMARDMVLAKLFNKIK